MIATSVFRIQLSNLCLLGGKRFTIFLFSGILRQTGSFVSMENPLFLKGRLPLALPPIPPFYFSFFPLFIHSSVSFAPSPLPRSGAKRTPFALTPGRAILAPHTCACGEGPRILGGLRFTPCLWTCSPGSMFCKGLSTVEQAQVP